PAGNNFFQTIFFFFFKQKTAYEIGLGIPAEPLFRSQITRRRFLNEWEAFKKVISRRNIRRRITIPLTLSNLNFLDESPERKTSFIEISHGGKLPYKTGSPAISVQVKAPLALRYSITVVAVAGKRTSARVNIVPCSGTKKRGTESI